MEMRECLRKPVGSEWSSHGTGAALAFQFLQSSAAKSAGEEHLYESCLPVASCSALNKGLLTPSLWGEKTV